MTGRLFARLLKQTPEARHDFEQFLLERRIEIHKQLESEPDRKKLYRLQGKIGALDDIANYLDQLLEHKDTPDPS